VQNQREFEGKDLFYAFEQDFHFSYAFMLLGVFLALQGSAAIDKCPTCTLAECGLFSNETADCGKASNKAVTNTDHSY
jgi:hypothetical protein